MSTIAWCEFLCGPIGEHEAEFASTILSERVSFLEADASLAARLFNESGHRRGSLTDCMIAAAALRSGAALATANPSLRPFRDGRCDYRYDLTSVRRGGLHPEDAFLETLWLDRTHVRGANRTEVPT